MKNKTTSGESLVLSALTLGTVFYSTFIYQKVWNWFIASYLFQIGYWEMMLGAAVIGFIAVPRKRYSEVKKFNEKIDKLSFTEKLEDRVSDLILTTMLFGIFFLIKLLITYFS